MTNSRSRAVEEGIWSALSPETSSQPCDGRAKLYDWLIGSRIYNRLAWEISPAAYERCAAVAVECGDGPFLDAGCGTLVSTAEVHTRSGRPTVLVGLSLDMLRAARDRLVGLAGRLPQHLVMLQADLRSLPFRSSILGSLLAQACCTCSKTWRWSPAR